jgi:FixJ family two-component response regulator
MNESVSQIYVVDDDLSVREGVGRLIRSAELNVKTFPTAQELIASLQQELPSCLVLDVQLPDINGFELQQQLAKKAYRYRSSFSLVTATSHRVCVP